MCDYSLHGLKSRLAVKGERLVVYKFHTGTKGLTTLADLCRVKEFWEPALRDRLRDIWRVMVFTFILPFSRRRADAFWESRGRHDYAAEPAICAVCVPPGTRLSLCAESLSPPTFAWWRRHKKSETEARVIHMSEESFRHRDALEFMERTTLSFQDLPDGLEVSVLSIELPEEPAAEAETRRSDYRDGFVRQPLTAVLGDITAHLLRPETLDSVAAERLLKGSWTPQSEEPESEAVPSLALVEAAQR